MADFRINVIVDPSHANRGIAQVNKQLENTSQTADRLRNLIQRAFVFVGATVGIRQLSLLADAYTTLNNRVRVATEGASFSAQVLERVFQTANRARAPVGQLAVLYQRASTASRELGASQEDILRFVDATAQALAIQGGASSESAGALLQLSQALGNANIQAQEFNSLIDGAFPLVQAAARGIDEAGGSVSRLRQLVLQGRVSNQQFFRAILDQSDELAATFAQTTPTISQAFTVLNNNLIRFVGETDQATGVTRIFAQIIIALANNLNIVTNALVAAAGAYILYRNSAAISATVQFIATQVELAKAVSSGRATLIQGVAADRARAASAVAAAQAEVERTAAVLASTRAEAARAVVVRGSTEADFARLAVQRQITILESQNAAASARLVAAQAQQAAVLGPLQRLWQGFTRILGVAFRFLGGIPGLIIGAVTALALFSDEISLTSGGLATLEDLFVVTFQAAVDAIKPFIVLVQEVFAQIGTFFAPIIEALKPAIDAIIAFFDQIDFSVSGVLRLSARITDRFIGLWVGAIQAIVAAFRNFPALIGEFVINAVNGINSNVQSLINTVIQGINNLRQFADLDPIELVNLPQLENQFAGGAADLGRAVRDAFLDGFQQTSLEDLINRLLQEAEQRAQRRAQQTQQGLPGAPAQSETIGPQVQHALDQLDREAQLLRINAREREILAAIFQIEETLRRQLNGTERQAIDTALRRNQLLRDQAQIIEELNGPQEELIRRQETLNALYQQGAITTQQFNDQLLSLRLQQAELNMQQGQGSFTDGFLLGIENMLEAVRNFSAESGQLFGDFFNQVNEGFGQAVGNAIVFGESFEDAVGNVARRALADLIAGLVQLGLQYVLNATLGETVAATATAAGVAQAATLSAAYATPAALASLASFGTNSAPASAGIATTVALANSLAALPAFADGGSVRGAGSSRSDSIPALLSNGEFVVNAKSAARFRPLLEQINNPGGFQDGGSVSPQAAAAMVAAATPSQPSQSSVRIVNNFDPNLFEDFVTSPNGERVIINVLERNANSVQQILRNN